MSQVNQEVGLGRTRPAAGVIRGFRDVTSRLAVWDARRRFRHELAHLDAHLLDDIGLTPGQVAAERAKPFWRA